MKAKKKILISALVLIFIVLAMIFTVSYKGITGLSTEGSETSNDSNVKIATFAVCEPQGELTYCRDKIYASCNKTLIEVNGSSFICDWKEYKVGNDSLGETYIKNFTDPRAADSITAWAIAD